MAVSGDVHDVYLPNLIHLICIEKRTAVLRLERRGENALIYFDEGDIVHALSSTYKLGTEAFYHVLGWDSGTFHLQLGVPVPRKTIKMSCAKLLINAVDRIDSKPDRDAKEMAKELTPEEIVRDTYLENELIVLMSVLENMQSRFSDQKILSKPEKLMELLAGMVNEIAACVERHKDMIVESDPLGNFLALTAYSFPASRYLKVERNRISSNSCLDLYKVLKKNKTTQQQFFTEIRDSLLHVMLCNYEHLLTSFNNFEFRKQWSDTGKDLFSDLGQIIKREN